MYLSLTMLVRWDNPLFCGIIGRLTLKFIHCTYTYENKQGPDWVHMELISNPLPTLTSSLPHNCNTQFTNPVVEASLKIWLQFRKYFDLK